MRARDICDSLSEYYLSINDVVQFKETAFEVLREISASMMPFRFEKNFAFMKLYMDLLVVYVKLHIMVAAVPEKRLLVGMYGRGYFVRTSGIEGNFAKIAKFIVDLESAGAVARVQLDLLPLSSRVGDTLAQLNLPFSKSTTPAVIRKEHVLNPVPKTGNMIDPITDQFVYELSCVSDFYDWMVFGFLACPNEIPERVEQWRLMLQFGYAATVHGAETIIIHKEFEDTITRGGKKLEGLKKILADATTQCVSFFGITHKEKRDLLIIEMERLHAVYSDTPGLLGPRIQQVYAALHFAKMEVECYFRHIGITPPKSKGKLRDDDFSDDDLSFLIHRLDQLSTLVRDNMTVIQRYHIEFLSGLDLTQIKKHFEACDKSGWEAGIQDIVKQSIDDLGRLNPNLVTQGKCYDLSQLRENWMRVLGYLSIMQRPGATPANYEIEMELFGAISLALTHARNIDLVDDQIKAHSSLQYLYYRKEPVAELFERIVESTGFRPLHTMSFVKILDHYPENGHPFLPEERANIGKEAVQLGIKYLRVIMTRVEKLLGAINGNMGFEQLRRQVAPIRAVNLLQKKENYKPPGYESRLDQRDKLDQFRAFQVNLARLCTAVSSTESIVIYDQEFCPREWVHTLIAISMRKFLNTGMDGLGNILRPSIVEKAVFDYITALTQVEAHVTIDVNNIVSKSLLEQFCDLTLTGSLSEELESGVSGRKDGGVSGGGGGGGDSQEDKDKILYVRKLSDWFMKFVTRLVPSGGIVYSENRRAFISQIGAEFRAEDFVDYSELISLCSLVGPYGIRAIDHDLLISIGNFARDIKTQIFNNRVLLVEFAQKYQDENACLSILKQLKGIDVAILNAVRMGTCLKLRQLLFDVLAEVGRRRIPVIHDTVKNAYAQYEHPPPLHNVPQSVTQQYARIDQAASDCGLHNHPSVDSAFRAAVSNLNQSDSDTDLWNLLPYLFAAIFSSPLWKEADYHINVAAHLKNFHTMVDSFYSLMWAMHTLSAKRSEKFPPFLDFVRAFLQCSAVIVLRHYSTEHPVPATSSGEGPATINYFNYYETMLSNGSLNSNSIQNASSTGGASSGGVSGEKGNQGHNATEGFYSNFIVDHKEFVNMVIFLEQFLTRSPVDLQKNIYDNNFIHFGLIRNIYLDLFEKSVGSGNTHVDNQNVDADLRQGFA